ncbi:SNF2 family N-terminal domain-containing protein [Lactarius psammicola]|nr:SNF2 family N-terminal domain-containing protein [Lactarius psammicola]
MPSRATTERLYSGSTGEPRSFCLFLSQQDGAPHRGCVTPQLLGTLSKYGVDRIVGLSGLQAEDQARVRLALKQRRVDPANDPSSSQPVPQPSQQTSTQMPTPNEKKRKAVTVSDVIQSQNVAAPSPTQAAVRRAAIGGAAWEEGADADEVVEQQVDELFCTLSSNVVGVQYYKGLVDVGEQVRLIREPHNKYDRNAIAVQNIGRMQVGHIPRQTASKLAPLMDSGLDHSRGHNERGEFAQVQLLLVCIYGAADKRNKIEPLLNWANPVRSRPSVPATYDHSSYDPRSSSAAPSATQKSEVLRKQQEEFARAAELRQMLVNLERVDDEGRRSSLLDNLCSTEDVLDLPEHPSPPGIASGELRVDLLRHQKQALLWAIEHENPKLPTQEKDKPVQFWQYRRTGPKAYYYNVVTKTPQEVPPILGRGALCGDSMGLGKTLTMIALILATKNDISSDYSNSTLIVVPLSVLSNWEKQIQDHCVPNTLSYAIYYGSGRDLSANDLQKYDIVVTTYQTVVGENSGFADGAPNKKRRKETGNLFAVQWKRIILDEGHNIRNPRTKMAQSVCALNAQRRWVLTGTPIINSPQDLGSILTFLRICNPLDNPDFQTRLLLRPLKNGDPSGAELLRAIMSQICIRRTKEMQDRNGNFLVPLPGVEMTVVPVTLNPEARELYDIIEQLSKDRIEGLLNQPQSTSFSTNALSMLTRLRQLALHPGLIPSDYVDQLQRTEEDNNDRTVQLTPEEKARMQRLLVQAIEDNEECPICFGVLSEPRITACSHWFCLACIAEVISRDARCPMDRRDIGMGDLIEPPPPTELTQAPIPLEDDLEEAATTLRSGSSAKIDQLTHLLRLTPEKEKSLVFSQFTSFLDKIAEVLDKEGSISHYVPALYDPLTAFPYRIPYVRFDGTMSARRRQETIEAFCVPIEDTTGEIADVYSTPVASASEVQPTRRVRSSRRRGAEIMDGEQDAGPIMISDDDDVFVPQVDAIDDDALTWNKKGKRRAKGKRKATAQTWPTPAEDIAAAFRTSATNGVNPKVMLISLKAGALGLNLTVANNVYLMDPWWQEGIESQAIDRCNRIGQKRKVHVYQLIAENTVEAKVLDIQERKKKLITEAFSGMKSKETPRQKKEARLQDLIEIFGLRRQTVG